MTQVLFRDGLRAIDKMGVLFGTQQKGLSAFRDLVQLLLKKPSPRVILYLGSGCSRQVFITPPMGRSSQPAPDWTELLKRLLDKFDVDRQKGFFSSLKGRIPNRARSIDDLLKSFDKLTVAWHIGSTLFGNNKDERDDAIRKIVEPAAGSTRSSPLFDQLKSTRFSEIITTNYDSNIQHFFDPEKKMLREITCTEDLYKTLDGTDLRGLYYLHGKAGRSPLVLDRFDYAQLLAEPNGILQYVTFLLLNSHIIYIGFGLDDPTFNWMETRLHVSGKRPVSFAFLSSITEGERELWRSRNLKIIDYGSHDNLARLFECVNEICRFVEYAEPNRPPDVELTEDRTGSYLAKGTESYVYGKYDESIKAYREALASTLFWERNASGHYIKSGAAEHICDILIRLAQSHYKLRWTRHADSNSEDHAQRMERNLKDALTILKHLARRQHVAKRPDPSRLALLALQNSATVLQARIRYHEGQFNKAKKIYLRVVKATGPYVLSDKKGDKMDKWSLKIAEAYYYAQCQISRIDYQFRTRNNWRQQQIDILRQVAQDATRICTSIADSENSGIFTTGADRDLYLSNMATILRIARWTEGRLTIRVFSDLVPAQEERSVENLNQLTSGIDLLRDDPAKELCSAIQMDVPAPARWLAMKYRYEARGHALRWVLKAAVDGRPDPADILEAFTCMQRAMAQTEGRELKRQEILNMLEAARLGIFAMFGERIGSGVREILPGSLSRSITLIHLNDAFRMIDDSNKSAKPPTHQWHSLLAHRLASYFGLLASPISREELENVSSPALNSFLQYDVNLMKNRVKDLYGQFDDGEMSGRVEGYLETFSRVEREINGLSQSAFVARAPREMLSLALVKTAP